MIRLRTRTALIGLAALALLLGLVRSVAALGRGGQSALTQTTILCVVFSRAIAVIGNAHSPRLAFALFALLAVLAIALF